jgi:hypothetical protein
MVRMDERRDDTLFVHIDIDREKEVEWEWSGLHNDYDHTMIWKINSFILLLLYKCV